MVEAQEPLVVPAATANDGDVDWLAGNNNSNNNKPETSDYFFKLDTSESSAATNDPLPILLSSPNTRQSQNSSASAGIRVSFGPIRKFLMRSSTSSNNKPRGSLRSSHTGTRSSVQSFQSSSYGSVTEGGDTISHYTYYDSAEYDYGFDDETQHLPRYVHTIRALEHCRRRAVSVLLVLTLLVILFGVTSVDPEFAAEMAQKALVVLSPSRGSSEPR